MSPAHSSIARSISSKTVSILSRIAEPLFVFDPQARRYEPLDASRYADIVAGQFKI